MTGLSPCCAPISDRCRLLLSECRTVFLRALYIFTFLCLAHPLEAQDLPDSTEKETIIENITVQGRDIPENEWDDVVIAERDTIRFYFWCQANGLERDRFLFRTTLRRQNGQERSQEVNFTPVRFVGLAEGGYIFSVYATGRPAVWRTTAKSIHFRVDSRLAAERDSIRRQQEVQDSLARLAAQEQLESKDSWLAGSAARIGAGSVVLLLVIGTGVTVYRRRKQLSASAPSHAANDTGPKSRSNLFHNRANGKAMASDSLSNEQLLGINSALRAEIAALRGQIEALQIRTEELGKTNSDLMEQKERLLRHKVQLEELQTQKDDLFAMVVHDIKNPAGIIKGLVELLRSYDLTAMEQQEIMEDLMSTSSKILSLAQEVSRVLALESGTLNLDLARYDLAEIIDDVCRRNGRNAAQKDIKIIKDVASELAEVELDVQKMEEVFDNLVSNAIKFSHKGAMVQVSAVQKGKRVLVEVVDNGLGLSEEDIKRAFGKGARLSARPTDNETSSGLGLWIVKRIIEAHHGRVWVKSSLGQGATFALEIPLTQPKKEEVES